MMLKGLKAGETIRRKPNCGPWLIIKIFDYGWLVVDLLSADDPSIPKIVLPRDYENWEKDSEITDKEIDEWQGIKPDFDKTFSMALNL